jgi:hypothetical protein
MRTALGLLLILAVPAIAQEASPTATTTDTPSPSASTTHPADVSGTPTATETPTAVPSPTSTSTPTPTSTPGLSAFRADPSNLPGPVTVSWELPQAVDKVQLKVFTSGFRMVRSFPFPKGTEEWTASGPKTLVWDGLDGRGKPLMPGTYFLFLTARKGKSTYTGKAQVQAP